MLFLDRIDSVPAINVDFDPQFFQWLWVLVDTLNEDIIDIQNAFNLLNASNYSATDIATMFSAGQLTDGMILYDLTNNLYVGKISGTLVKFTTTPYP